MNIKNIFIKEFRGIKGVNIQFNDKINFIVSDNNVGKTRVLEAINQFYLGREDAEIEIQYNLDENDLYKLKNQKDFKDYDSEILNISYSNKKYFCNGIDVKKLKEEGIFGEVIYIPAVSDHSNEVDMGKTSTQISKSIATLLSKSTELENKIKTLNDKLEEYISNLKLTTKSKFEEINESIMFSDIKLDVRKKQFDNIQILKNNLELFVSENGIQKNISELGTGIQRNIVNSILSSGINDGFTIILYDEPETFINVKAQRKLMSEINKQIGQVQYIIATHSPDIIYRSENIFNRIIKLKKIEGNNLIIYQYTKELYKNEIEEANKKLIAVDSDYQYMLKEDINQTILAWWDRNRVNAIFEDKILVLEGPTEEIYLDFNLLYEDISYVTCASGKFSIPYLFIFFSKIFGIDIRIICDRDNNDDVSHKVINTYISSEIKCVEFLEKDLETELGYQTTNSHRKPQEFLEKYFNNQIEKEKNNSVIKKVLNVWNKE